MFYASWYDRRYIDQQIIIVVWYTWCKKKKIKQQIKIFADSDKTCNLDSSVGLSYCQLQVQAMRLPSIWVLWCRIKVA